MIDAVVEQALSEAGVQRTRVVVGVSGGRDSMVLLDVLDRAAPGLRLELVVAHVHHGLRGADADADAAFVEARAGALGWPHQLRRVDVAAARVAGPSRDRPSPEEAARDLRRGALRAIADAVGAGWIALAHHAGDQAETLLLRLLRGTGPDGLAGMAPVDAAGRVVRPMLGVMPEAVAAHARDRGLAWREDASNRDPRFARNRLRHEFLPALAEAFNPNLLRNLSQLAEAEGTERAWIESLVDEAAKERIELGPGHLRLAIDGWDALPEALARRLARRALLEAGLGRSLSRVHVERTLAFLRRGRGVGRDRRLELPEGAVLRRVDEGFRLDVVRAPDESVPGRNATLPRRD